MPTPDDHSEEYEEKKLSMEMILESALEGYKYDYSEQIELWRAIDTKAQGNSSVAGIFLAGLFAFARTLGEVATAGEKWLILFTIFLLVLSIVFSLISLTLKEYVLPPIGIHLQKITNDLQKLSRESLSKRKIGFLEELILRWSRSCDDISQVIESKARYVVWAQRTLVIAICFAALTTGMFLWI